MNNNDTMKKVAIMNYQPSDLKIRGNSADVRICPKCGRKWKLHMDFTKNVFRCPACDFSGNAVKLHATLNNISYEQAKKELKINNSFKSTFVIQKEPSNSAKTASLRRRDFIYGLILSSGSLTKSHQDNLLSRGVPKEYLKEYVSCCTIPDANKILASKNMWFVDPFNDYKISLIPGFYGQIQFSRKNNIELHDKIHINLPDNGFLIPIISHENDRKLISCCQIRMDYGDSRYIYLSSLGKMNGISVTDCNKVHYTRNFFCKNGSMNIPQTVNLTEGALKADIASYISNRQFIAIPGVNSTKGLESELLFLKAKGCKQINIYFDTDYLTNPNVQEALNKIKIKISNAGLLYKQVVWNSDYKGIDDYLAHFMGKE